MSKKKEVFSSAREANRALWDNDSPFRQKIVPEKRKRYKRREKFIKGSQEPFALSIIP